MGLSAQVRTEAPASVGTTSALGTRDAAVWPRVHGGLSWVSVCVCFVMPLVVLPSIERPFSFPKLVLLTASVVLGLAATGLAGRWQWPLLPRAFSYSLAMWLAALGASALFGNFASISSLWLPLVAIGWFLLLMLVQPRAERLAIALVAAGLVIAGIAILQFIGWDPFALAGWLPTVSGSARMRVFSTLGNPNFVAAFLVGIMPMTAWLMRIPKWRNLFLIAFSAQALAVFATGSRGAILGLLAALLWILALGQLANWRGYALAVLLVSVALLAWSPARNLATTINGRYYIWRTVTPHVVERPLLGFGPGSVEPHYSEWNVERLKRLGAPADEQKFAEFEDHAHNDYLETLLENGAIGLAGFLSILVCFLAYVYRHQDEKGVWVVASSAGVVSLAAVALVDFPFRRPAELFLFWTLIALVLSAKSSSSSLNHSESNALVSEGIR